jgi:hypothetical protein
VADNRLARVFWLGGSPCSGKSTVATALAMRHGLRVYSADDHFERHCAAADPRTQPSLAWLRTATSAQIFLRPLRPMVRDAIVACREAFAMVLSDLTALPVGPSVLAEGMAILPECVATIQPPAGGRAFLVPTRSFQRSHYAQREWAAALVARLPTPDRAFENWMRRDEVSARWIRLEATRHGYPVREVDDGDSIEEVVMWVEQQMNLAVQ